MSGRPGETGVRARAGGLAGGPLSGAVATSAIHQIRGFTVVVGLVTSPDPTSGCRSRDVGRTQEKALRTSMRSWLPGRRRSVTDDDGGVAAAAGDMRWEANLNWTPAGWRGYIEPIDAAAAAATAVGV